VPRLLTRLSPGDGMIPDEAIMAPPIGLRQMITWPESVPSV
jgi:hypothetical protein